jgi:hypothetical protein
MNADVCAIRGAKAGWSAWARTVDSDDSDDYEDTDDSDEPSRARAYARQQSAGASGQSAGKGPRRAGPGPPYKSVHCREWTRLFGSGSGPGPAGTAGRAGFVVRRDCRVGPSRACWALSPARAPAVPGGLLPAFRKYGSVTKNKIPNYQKESMLIETAKREIGSAGRRLGTRIVRTLSRFEVKCKVPEMPERAGGRTRA